MTTTLKVLLDEGEQFDPIYVPSMNTDHLPMTLVAMAHLGATDDALRHYQQRYQQRLRPVQTGPKLSAIDEGRGQANAFSELRRLLIGEIEQRGFERVVETYLPGLLPSLPAGAFHPLIRLGFAVTARHDVEVASALAYWMTSRLHPPIKNSPDLMDLTQALQQLPALDLPTGRFGEGLYKLVELGRYPSAVNTSLEDCARTSLDVYLGTRNFFALHFVTGTQAARVCSPYVEAEDLVAALTAAIQAGYLVVGAPDFSQPLPPPRQLDEEHNLKYMYACVQEYVTYGDTRYIDEMNGFVKTGLVPDWIHIPD